MNVQELISFLKKFNVDSSKIEEYINDKKIVEKNGNLFLRKRDFEKYDVFDDSLIYIKLNELVPSKYLLDFIRLNSKNVVRVKSEKRALDFTYGKDLFFDLVTKHPKVEFSEGNNFIVEFDLEILGVVRVREKRLINEFHIGKYLKEN